MKAALARITQVIVLKTETFDSLPAHYARKFSYSSIIICLMTSSVAQVLDLCAQNDDEADPDLFGKKIY